MVVTVDMALPAIKSLPQCADVYRTVLPYLPELYELPKQIYSHINDPTALKTLYLATNPLISALAFALALAPVVLVVSEINKNYSQVDRLWSILPVLYNCHYATWAHMAGLPTNRLNHIVAISILWGLRLTFNYWRKGGYQIGSEDYRWEVLKEKIGPVLMFIFNVLFISLAQSLLLFMITTPTYVLLLTSRHEDTLNVYDNVFSRLMLVLIIIEVFADQQQWNYQQAKKAYQATAKPQGTYTREQLDRGFVTTGLWAWSRHPNFAAEQSIWFCLYQWSCCQTGTYMNWTFLGAFSYLILFQASTWFTETISEKKYADYKIYQKKVAKFIPKFGAEAVVWDAATAVKDEMTKKSPSNATKKKL